MNERFFMHLSKGKGESSHLHHAPLHMLSKASLIFLRRAGGCRRCVDKRKLFCCCCHKSKWRERRSRQIWWAKEVWLLVSSFPSLIKNLNGEAKGSKVWLYSKFEASLGYMRVCLQTKQKSAHGGACQKQQCSVRCDQRIIRGQGLGTSLGYILGLKKA